MGTKTKSHTEFLRDPDLPFLEARDSRLSGRPFGMHSHGTCSVAVVGEGSTMMWCRGGEWLVKPGAVVFLPPGEPHACNPGPGAVRAYRMFYFERSWFEDSLDRLGPAGKLDPATPAILDDEAVAEAFLAFGEALSAGAPASEKLRLLNEALRMLLESRAVLHLDGGQPRADHRAARLAARRIAESPAGRITLAELAACCGVTPCHLTRIFRRAHGMTPHAYQNQLRVELAKKLLAAGTPIAETAAEAGFTDQSHLNRVFRRYAGATPRQYMLGSRRPV
ncbi:MAG: AraC family transcriptional regulator [Thermodesulfobacteriota bacterium]